MGILSKITSIFARSKDPSSVDESAITRLELALESSGMVDWDFDYEKNTAHRGLKHDQLYGYQEMLPSWNFENFFHHVLPEFHQELKDKFENLHQTGVISSDFKIRRVDGSVRWLTLKGRGQKNREGKVIRVAGILKDVTVERDQQAEVTRQIQNLLSLFEKAPEFFCIINRSNLVYEYVNPAHIELFNGRNMTGLSVTEAQPELKESPLPGLLRKVSDTGEAIIFRDVPAQIGERLRYLDMIYAPKRNIHGKIDGIFALGSDVTLKVTALKAAENSEAQIRLITDKLPAFVSYTDNEGRYRFMNKMYEVWFNRPISEMLGKTRDEITPAEYAIQAKPMEKNALKGSASHHEGFIRKANGEFLNLDINFIPDIDPDSNLTRGMIAVGADVTAQVQALKEAELARRDLHEVFMQAPTPMCLLTGDDYVFSMANPLYVDFVKRNVIGKTLDEAFKGEDITLFREIIKQVYTTGEPYEVSQAPLELYDESGQLFKKYINVGYHAYKNIEGIVKGVLVIIQDVTDQVNSVIARDNFMGIASHELKTPITALKLHMQMNQKILQLDGVSAFTEKKLEKLFSDTISQVNRLARLVDDMLDVSRISAEELQMNFAEANLSSLVLRIFELFTPQLENVGITLELNVEENIVVKMDEDRMEQVLVNLITNAIRYAPHGAMVVRVSKTDQNVLITIQDNGIGIDKKFHDKIFDRFERVNSGRDISGLGLGLYISKKIITHHRGTISVQSEQGKGSTFRITLPIS